MNRFRLIAAACLLLAGGCAESKSPSRTTAGGAPAADAPTPMKTGEFGEFAEDGPLGVVGSRAGDATQVSSLVVGSSGQGEQFVIGFSKADGLPAAAVGPSLVEFLRPLGLVRIRLPKDVVTTAIADNVFATFLAQNAYVVRAAGGDSMFIDLHLRSAAKARVRAAENPALIVVELESGGSPLPAAAAVRSNVVVVEPRAGRAAFPLAINGYSRTFEANVIAQLRRGGAIAGRTHGTAADWVSTWGEYRLRIESAPGSGGGELFVGEHSAQDGSEHGVTIPLELP